MNYRRCPPISCINANAGCYRIVEQGQIERARSTFSLSLSLTLLPPFCAVILQPRNGLLMHYSSANAVSAARVLPRCCALTCPKLRQHNVRETPEERDRSAMFTSSAAESWRRTRARCHIGAYGFIFRTYKNIYTYYLVTVVNVTFSPREVTN